MALRDYQEQAVRRAIGSTENLLLVSPTASGKTVIGAEIARISAVKTLWIAGRHELLDQARSACEGVGTVTFSTPDQASKSRVTDYQLVIIDEAHHVAAITWSAIVRSLSSAKVIGLTATPQRGDGAGLSDIFSDLYVVTTPESLVKAGHIVPLKIFAPHGVPGETLDPVAVYRENHDCRQAFIFADSVKASIDYANRLNDEGFKARHIDGRTSEADRAEALRAFRAREIAVLSSVNLFLEGLDVPSAELAICARKFSVPGSWIQCAGRLSRSFEGKNHATIIDLHENIFELGHPYEEREFSLDGKPISLGTKTHTQCLVCYRVFVGARCPTGCEHNTITRSRKKITREEQAAEMAEVYASHTITYRQRWYVQQRAILTRLGRNPNAVFFEYKRRYGHNPPWDWNKLSGRSVKL